MHKWTLHKDALKRFRFSHPWVFSNELQHSPKGIEAGELIQLQGPDDQFLAYGYGHPNSLISFRILSRQIEQPIGVDLFVDKLKAAYKIRKMANLTSASHRLVFSEADGLPGLIVDTFILDTDKHVFVLQPHTAGMDRLTDELVKSVKMFATNELRLSDFTIIIARNSSSRTMEGLEVKGKEIVLGNLPEKYQIKLRHLDRTISVWADLLEGQKTGFFLDQQQNVNHILPLLSGFRDKKVKILDICTYVGQWSSHLAYFFKAKGIETEIYLVDSSQAALDLATKNVEQFSSQVHPIKMDVMNDWSRVGNDFDIIICDPPAFVKKKKDIPVGLKAYTKLNKESLSRLKAGGLYITCSCSGLVNEEDFSQAIQKAVALSHRSIRWLYKGGHGPDHPWLLEFPQGYYLKCFAGYNGE